MAAQHRLDYGSIHVSSVLLHDGSGKRLVRVDGTCVCGFAMQATAESFVEASKLLHDAFARHVSAEAGNEE